MKETSLFSRPFHPVYQGLLCLLLYTIAVGVDALWCTLIKAPFDKESVWVYSTAMILFYIIMNVVFMFSAENKMVYYRNSVLSFIGFVMLTSIFGQFISGLSLFEVRTFSWITTVFIIVYLVFLTIVNLMRKIVDYALKQDKKLENEK